jgi:hypothetical protein
MELLWYAPHLNTEKLKVNRFVFGLNDIIRAKVRILMPQTLHDVHPEGPHSRGGAYQRGSD